MSVFYSQIPKSFCYSSFQLCSSFNPHFFNHRLSRTFSNQTLPLKKILPRSNLTFPKPLEGITHHYIDNIRNLMCFASLNRNGRILSSEERNQLKEWFQGQDYECSTEYQEESHLGQIFGNEHQFQFEDIFYIYSFDLKTLTWKKKILKRNIQELRERVCEKEKLNALKDSNVSSHFFQDNQESLSDIQWGWIQLKKFLKPSLGSLNKIGKAITSNFNEKRIPLWKELRIKDPLFVLSWNGRLYFYDFKHCLLFGELNLNLDGEDGLSIEEIFHTWKMFYIKEKLVGLGVKESNPVVYVNKGVISSCLTFGDMTVDSETGEPFIKREHIKPPFLTEPFYNVLTMNSQALIASTTSHSFLKQDEILSGWRTDDYHPIAPPVENSSSIDFSHMRGDFYVTNKGTHYKIIDFETFESFDLSLSNGFISCGSSMNELLVWDLSKEGGLYSYKRE